jgi:hypothetical protein
MIAIVILLMGIVLWCFGSWLLNLYLWGTGQFLTSEHAEINEHMFKHGLCGTIALGFLGIILK